MAPPKAAETTNTQKLMEALGVPKEALIIKIRLVVRERRKTYIGHSEIQQPLMDEITAQNRHVSSSSEYNQL